MIEKQPDEITVCTLECVLMPQGEIISHGKTLGWFDEFKKYLTVSEHPKHVERRMLGRGLWLAVEELLVLGCDEGMLCSMLDAAGMDRKEMKECLEKSSYHENEQMNAFIENHYPDQE